MDLATRLTELQKRTVEHREVLLTEEAAKTTTSHTVEEIAAEIVDVIKNPATAS